MQRESENTVLIYYTRALIVSFIFNFLLIYFLYSQNFTDKISDHAITFLLNILSAIFIATILAYLVKKDNPLEPFTARIDDMNEEIKNISVMRKVILPNVTKDFDGIADDIYQVNNLIEKEQAIRIPSQTYIDEMKRARKDFNSSYHIFPVTFLSLDGFYADKAVGGEWFDFEFDHIEKPENQGKDIKRILIIEDELQNKEKTLILIKRAITHNCNWRFIIKSNLSTKEQRFFRNFALFYNTNADDPEIAFFTYLDIKNVTMFTKSSWAAYRTYDKDYMLKLKNDFEFLWEKCSDIKRIPIQSAHNHLAS